MNIDQTEILKYFAVGDTIPRCVDRSINYQIKAIYVNSLELTWGNYTRSLSYTDLSILIKNFKDFRSGATLKFEIRPFVRGLELTSGKNQLYAMAKEYRNRSKKGRVNRTQQPAPNVPRTLEDVQREFENDVEEAKKRSSEERKARLEKAPKKPPESSTVTTKVFRRNADVVAAVLERAKGECERKGKGCKNPIPFQRNDGSTFLEVHHRIRLADGGDDTVENAIALCPNCHRELHFGKT